MAWNLNSNEPIYLQLTREIKMRIISGLYPAGCQLPGVRILAQEAAVNPNTMQKAFAELEREGLVYTQRTSGRFVTEDTVMLENLKIELAQKDIKTFLTKMKKIGLENSEIAALLQRIIEEELL